jgi:predicted metal-dependent hydrolase
MVRRKTLRPTLIGTYHATLEDKPVPYTLKRSRRARYVRLEVRVETGLTLVVPRYYDMEDLPALLCKKTRWILDKLAEFGRESPPVVERELKHGDLVPYLGGYLRIVKSDNVGTGTGIKRINDNLVVNQPARDGELQPVVEKWFRQQAKRLIRKRVDELCPILGVTYSRLTIRNARTRWGSCSPRGNLSFNWKLAMVPGPVVDYVIIHELTHRKQMNHSRKFWKLMDEHCPRWPEHRKWLRSHEVILAARPAGEG